MTIEKEFMDLDEVAAYVGLKRASIYNYVRDFGIQTHKFKRNRRVYLAFADVKRMKEASTDKPWVAGEKKNKIKQ